MMDFSKGFDGLKPVCEPQAPQGERDRGEGIGACGNIPPLPSIACCSRLAVSMDLEFIGDATTLLNTEGYPPGRMV